MKSISLNIVTRIREWMPLPAQKQNEITVIPKAATRAKRKTREKPLENKGEADLALMQRKAYQGHFMAGAYALLNPGLFK